MISGQSFRLGMVQMRVEGGDLSGNLGRAKEGIARAARGGANVVVLPEAMDVGWTDPSARELASEVPGGQACEVFADSARKHRVYVCGGVTERAGKLVYNAAVLVGPGGQILVHHRKLNELEIGHEVYAQGDRLSVAKTELGTFGVMICADAFVRDQVISRTLGVMGAQVILSPSAWAVEANHDQVSEPYGQLWLDNYGPVAKDFGVWIAGVSNVGWIRGGPWKGRKCIGCSLLVGREGQKVAMGPYGVDAETILYADVAVADRCPRHHSSSMSKA